MKTRNIFAQMALIVGLALPGVSVAENQIATLAGRTPIAETTTPPAIPKVVNSDVRQVRNYPEQPPLIPHKIDGYQIDLTYNQCMTCHARAAVEISQAPMVSITHFMDREGQFLASISPRRFFCTQCHVPQTDAPALVDNQFVDIDAVLEFLNNQEGGNH